MKNLTFAILFGLLTLASASAFASGCGMSGAEYSRHNFALLESCLLRSLVKEESLVYKEVGPQQAIDDYLGGRSEMRPTGGTLLELSFTLKQKPSSQWPEALDYKLRAPWVAGLISLPYYRKLLDDAIRDGNVRIELVNDLFYGDCDLADGDANNVRIVLVINHWRLEFRTHFEPQAATNHK